MPPKVSVVIPVYNTAPYLRRCLDSVCNQTLSDIEIICVNDGSTDASPEILREYAQRDSRVVFLSPGENRGAATARNAGLAAARGEFVGFVDSDDYVDSCYYENLYRTAQASGADIAKGSLLQNGTADKKGQVRYNRKIAQKKFLFSINFTTAIYKMSLVVDNAIRFPDGIENYEDVVFLIKAVYYANTVHIVPDTFYHYTQRESSASQSHIAQITSENFSAVYIHIIEFINTVTIRRDHYNHIFLQLLNNIVWATDQLERVPENLASECLRLLRMNKYLPAYVADLETYLAKTRNAVDRLSRLRDDFHHSAVEKNTLLRILRLYLKSARLTVCLHIGSLTSGGAERQIVVLARCLVRMGVVVHLLLMQMATDEQGKPHGHYLPLLENTGIAVSMVNYKDFMSNGVRMAIRKAALFDTLTALPVPRNLVLCLTGAFVVLAPDIVHCYLDACNCHGGCAGLLADVPGIVLSGRNLDPTTYNLRLAEMTRPVYATLLPYNNVAMENNSSRGAAAYAQWLDIPGHAVSVNFNGFDPGIYMAADADARHRARRALGLDEHTPVVLYLSRCVPYKRPGDMLAIALRLCADMPTVHFVVAGVGLDESGEMFAHVCQRELAGRVHLLGVRQDIPNLLAAADVLLLTSAIEGFPNAIMEAMHTGLPVVATSVGGVPDLVRHGKNGFLHPVGDVQGMAENLARLLGDPALRHSMGSNGRRRLKRHFTVKKFAERVMLQYVALLRKHVDACI